LIYEKTTSNRCSHKIDRTHYKSYYTKLGYWFTLKQIEIFIEKEGIEEVRNKVLVYQEKIELDIEQDDPNVIKRKESLKQKRTKQFKDKLSKKELLKLKSKPIEPIYLDFNTRDLFNKIAYILYKLLKFLFVTIYVYFFYFILLVMIVYYPVTYEQAQLNEPKIYERF